MSGPNITITDPCHSETQHVAAELLAPWQQERKTVLMVAHSIAEALLLSEPRAAPGG